MKIEIEREEDGRWIAEAPDLLGIMATGRPRRKLLTKVETPALRIIADGFFAGWRIQGATGRGALL